MHVLYFHVLQALRAAMADESLFLIEYHGWCSQRSKLPF